MASRFPNRRTAITTLVCAGLAGVLSMACTQNEQPSTPGGQATSQIAGSSGRGGTITPPPVEIWQEGKLIHTLAWDTLEHLPTHSFSTGLDDEQTGYLLIDVLQEAGITEGKAVILHGKGNAEPTQMGWKAMANPANQILMGLTHKGTLKIVAGNFEYLNRDRWVRHLYKIEVTPGQPKKTKNKRLKETRRKS